MSDGQTWRSTGMHQAGQPLGPVMSLISIDPTVVIRGLTIAALSGLLLTVGLRLSWGEAA